MSWVVGAARVYDAKEKSKVIIDERRAIVVEDNTLQGSGKFR